VTQSGAAGKRIYLESVLTSFGRGLQSPQNLPRSLADTLKRSLHSRQAFRFSVPRLTGTIVLVVTLIHLLGWTFEIDLIRRPFTGFIGIYPWTAIMLASLSVVLILLSRRPVAGNLLFFLTGVAALLAVTFLVEDFLSTGPTRFDRLLFADQLPLLGGFAPGRPAAPLCVTTLIFAVGSFLFLVRRPGQRGLAANAAILLGCFFPGLALSGFLTRLVMPVLTATPASMGMSFFTAIYFLILATGFFALRRRSLLLIFWSSGLSGKVARRLFFFGLICPLMVGSIIFYLIAKGRWNDNLALGLVLMLTMASTIAALAAGALIEQHQRIQKRFLNRLRASSAKVDKLRQRNLTVCAWTRRIQDEDGNWDDLEHFLEKNLGVSVTHGMSTEAFEAVSQTIDRHAQDADLLEREHEKSF
jgi:hypothetical protein